VKAFGSSSSPLGDLSRSYVGSGLSDLISLGAMISAFVSGLGTATAGSRILFAMARDGSASRRLGQASRRTGAPAGALAVVMTIGLSVVASATRSTRTSRAPRSRTTASRSSWRPGSS
jgi:amino acid transporter